MKRLLLFGTGVAAGYVLGAKAGRGRYEQIVSLVSDAPRHLPSSVADLTGAVSGKADELTEVAREKAHAKAHDVVDIADQKIDDVADQAQQVRQQSEERLAPGTTTTGPTNGSTLTP